MGGYEWPRWGGQDAKVIVVDPVIVTQRSTVYISLWTGLRRAIMSTQGQDSNPPRHHKTCRCCGRKCAPTAQSHNPHLVPSAMYVPIMRNTEFPIPIIVHIHCPYHLVVPAHAVIALSDDGSVGLPSRHARHPEAISLVGRGGAPDLVGVTVGRARAVPELEVCVLAHVTIGEVEAVLF